MTAHERLESRSVRLPWSGCQIWMGCGVPSGCGTLSVDSRQQYVHRVSWELSAGRPVPDGMRVLHRCDTPPCINPDHLFIGTDADNVRDKMRKGRWNGGPPIGDRNPMRAHIGLLSGERHGKARLNESDVRAIRTAYADGETQTSLAAQFGVRQCHISRIIRGESWSHSF